MHTTTSTDSKCYIFIILIDILKNQTTDCGVFQKLFELAKCVRVLGRMWVWLLVRLWVYIKGINIFKYNRYLTDHRFNS